MKKIFVKALSVCLAMITLLVTSMLPVSAATTKASNSSVEDSLGNKVTAHMTVEYTPASGSTPASFHYVRGSSYLHTGNTIPATSTVYLHSLVGVVYDDDPSVMYYDRVWTKIDNMTKNHPYSVYSRNYSIAASRKPLSFNSWAMLAYGTEMLLEDCVNGLICKHYKHRSQILTQ